MRVSLFPWLKDILCNIDIIITYSCLLCLQGVPFSIHVNRGVNLPVRKRVINMESKMEAYN